MKRYEFSKTTKNKADDDLYRLEQYLRYQRGQADVTVKMTLIKARQLFKRYGQVEFTPEFGQQVWHDFREDGAAEQTIIHMLNTIELIALANGEKLTLNKPKKVLKEAPHLSPPELRALIASADNVRDRAILSVLSYTGLRNSEILKANVEQVSVKDRRLIVAGRTKNRKERTVVLTKECAGHVEDWLLARPDVDCNALFINCYGQRLTRNSLCRIVNRAGRSLGKRVFTHMLRHSCATAMLNAGIPMPIVMKQLGHSHISTTVMVYGHTTIHDVKDVIDKRFNI